MTLEWYQDELMAVLRGASMRGIIKATEATRNEAIRLIQSGEKTGRVYVRGGVSHQASAPGEPPASDTGELVNSITTQYDTEDISGQVVFGSKHAEFLEYGTVKMEPRPFARVALANTLDTIQDLISGEIQSSLGEGGSVTGSTSGPDESGSDE